MSKEVKGSRQVAGKVGRKNPATGREKDSKASIDGPQVGDAAEIDLKRLRLSAGMDEVVGRRRLMTVPVRNPDRQWWIRVHPDTDYEVSVGLLVLKEENEMYVVDRSVHHVLAGELSPRKLVLGITRQNVPFIWPLRLPGPDGRQDQWMISSLQAADAAKARWVRVAANMQLGGYELYEQAVDVGEPEWPELSFAKIIEIGFRGRIIREADHPVILRLMGQGF